MMTRLNVLILVWLLLMFGGIAGAQRLPARQANNFNLKITNLVSTRYVASVLANGQKTGVFGTWNLHHIADWKPSPELPSAAAVLKVPFWFKQDSVRMDVLAYLSEIALPVTLPVKFSIHNGKASE